MESHNANAKAANDRVHTMRIASSRDASESVPSKKRRSYMFDESGRDVVRGGIEKCCCNDSWVGFTRTTSLHGLRYIWLENAFTVRRLFWLALTVTCVGVMAYQIIDRVVYYYRWPVNVNVRVNYNKSLEFPTITICNENVFRATAAAMNGHYELISYMFGDVTKFSACDLRHYNTSHVTYESLVRSSAHTKEDMIVRCQWRGEPCGPHNFSEVLTDHGLCYTFNGIHDGTATPVYVHSTGSESGLLLTLNVEQYEYMPGPQDAAGVRVLIHDGKEFPKVHELGIAFPTGSHSFVGVKLISVRNLPSPHGECESPTLKYFPDYSLENCEVECVTEMLLKACGCRHYYMPTHPAHPTRVCSVEEIYTCYQHNIDKIKASLQESCGCAIPCQFHIFDPIVSYAVTSMSVIDRFLAETNRTALRQKYELARDVTDRLQKNKFEELKNLTDSANMYYDKLEDLISVNMLSKLEDQERAVNKLAKESLDMWFTMYKLFQYQKFVVQMNLLRARDAMNERTFSILGLGMQEFAFSVERKINQLTSNGYNDNIREALYLATLNQLDSRIDIAERTMANYTQLYDTYVKGKRIFNYKYLDFPRHLTTYIIPRHLLLSAISRTRYIKYRSKRLGYDIGNVTFILKEYKRIADNAFVNRTDVSEELRALYWQFISCMREYLQSKSMFFHDVLDWPIKQMEQREQRFQKTKAEFVQIREILDAHINSVKILLSKIQYPFLKDVRRSLLLCKDYVQTGNVSKLSAAEYINMKNLNDGMHDLSVFFDSTRRRCQEIHDGWSRIQVIVLKMWKISLSDVDVKLFLEHQNMTSLLQSYDVIEKAISGEISMYVQKLDLCHVTENADSDFVTAFKTLKNYMKEFKETSHIDSTFIRNNFLRLDIFYRELSYEQITQQEAYGVFGLLCDIGGSMGLFVGASVMTIFEIVDLIAYHSSVALRRRKTS